MPKYEVYITCTMNASTEIIVEAEDHDKAGDIALELAEKRPRDYGWDHEAESAECFEVMDVDEIHEPASEGV